jgi:hypothetical protein
MLRIPHCLDIRLTDGGEAIDLEFFSIYLILPTTLGPEIYSASKIIEYLTKKKCFWE